MRPQIFVLAVVTALLWGSAPLVEKMGLSKTSPEVGLAIRSIVITIGILSVVFITGRGPELFHVSPRAALCMAGGAVLSGFVGQLVYYHALKADQASRVVPLIGGFYPLVAAILALAILRGETVTLPRVLGAVFVVVGAVLLKMR